MDQIYRHTLNYQSGNQPTLLNAHSIHKTQNYLTYFEIT